MKKVHFFLNGKGGVGKSTKASFFIQYLKSFSTALGIDCDASNSTLSGYKALDIKQIKITSVDDNNTIDKNRGFYIIHQKHDATPKITCFTRHAHTIILLSRLYP